jgi:alpha-L-rhamnosidase
MGKLSEEKEGFTDKRYINTVFYGYMALLMKQTAVALNKPDDIKLYTSLFENIKTAFNQEYIDETGKVKLINGKQSDSQTAYVLALMFDLLPKELKSKAAAYLVADIKSRGNHLSTGFLGTPYLCHVLSDNGYTDVAYDLLLQKTHPSWLFPVTMGATTIWERWDGQKTDGTFQTTTMNSFNHYAYGAVGDWMYRVATGIEIDPLKPGYKHFYIQPKPTKQWSHAKSSLNSPYGEIYSSWEIKEGIIKLKIIIPVNSSATITLPKAKDNVILNNKPFNALNFKETKNTKEGMQFEAGSGDYTFEYKF